MIARPLDQWSWFWAVQHRHEWNDPSKSRYVSKMHYTKEGDMWWGRPGEPTIDTWEAGPVCMRCGVQRRYMCPVPDRAAVVALEEALG